MPFKNTAVKVTIVAWDTINNVGKTGDSGNITVRGVGDGTEYTPADTPTEIDATNLPGVYTVDLTAGENNYSFNTIGGKSSTANIVIIPISWSNESQTGDAYAVVTNATYGNSALSARIPAALTANGNMKASLVEILTTALTETAGQIAAAFKKFFNVATPVSTCESVNQGADNNVILADASKGLVKVYDDMSKPGTAQTITAPADMALNSTVAKETTLATVAGYLDTEIADIKAKTDTITTPPTASAIADAVLEESLADHKTVANSLAKALFETNQRLNSAKVVIDTNAGTINVYDTNGTDLLFTLTKTAAGNVYTITRT